MITISTIHQSNSFYLAPNQMNKTYENHLNDFDCFWRERDRKRMCKWWSWLIFANIKRATKTKKCSMVSSIDQLQISIAVFGHNPSFYLSTWYYSNYLLCFRLDEIDAKEFCLIFFIYCKLWFICVLKNSFLLIKYSASKI